MVKQGERDMNASDLTLEEIRERGLRALLKELGPVGMIRFLQQFETGHGDYTRDRFQWLGNPSLDDLLRQIESGRKAGGEPAS
jgi:hypothetical protein